MLRRALFIAFAALLCACSNNEQFRVNGTIEGKPTMNIRVSYYSEGGLRTIVTAAREGEFEFFGTSRQPTIVEICDYDYRPLTRLYAANGETFEVFIDRSNPANNKVDGNEISQRWNRVLTENAAKLSAGRNEANSAVEAYIATHPDDIISTLLLITAYDASVDPVMADSLLSSINTQARPSALTDGFNYLMQRLVTDRASDTIASLTFVNDNKARKFSPTEAAASLLAFTDDNNPDYDVVASRIEKAAKKKSGIIYYDLRTNPSRHSYEADTFVRITGRLPGGVTAKDVDRLGIPAVPFYIVTDSLGAQHYRGRALAEAFAKADSLAKLK